MNTVQISDIAIELRRKYLENDPELLSRELGILCSYEPMGVYDGCCKGFFVTFRRKKHITVNSDLPRELQRAVCAHELGHAVLHARTVDAQFSDLTLFDRTDRAEYEANVFAAELLLPDEGVLRAISDNTSFFDIASLFKVPFELLDIKLRILKKRGYRIESPVVSSGDFLRKVEARFLSSGPSL